MTALFAAGFVALPLSLPLPPGCGSLETATVLFAAEEMAEEKAEEKTLKPEDVAFFNDKVLPILKQRCYECHSHEPARKISGGLVVDSRDALLKGGDSGAAVVPGNPDKSLLVRAVRFDDEDLQMPPDEKMPDAEIAVLVDWVKRGAPDPRTTPAGVGHAEEIWQKARAHWAFQPIKKPEPPKTKLQNWVRTPIDAFILARLEQEKLRPSPPADKTTLLRRITFDLTGLPPTPAEAQAFFSDSSPQAYEKLIDRLLESPHYGERWARYWLDVARYADTTGETANQRRETRYLYAYTYRDYVIRSFNEDKPFNQFVLEQLAADRLVADAAAAPTSELMNEPVRDTRLAALGFLTIGKRFNNPDDVIDDRIDVVSRGLLGLTVSCARCHNHKFDPIPTEDYYSWHGVFASTEEPEQGPLIEAIDDDEQHRDYLKQLAPAERAVAEFEDREWNRVLSEAWQEFGKYLLAMHEFRTTKGSNAGTFYRLRELSAGIAGRWTAYLRLAARRHDPVFAPWLALAELPADQFAERAKPLVEKFAANADSKKPIHPLVAKLFEGEPPQKLADVAERYGKLFAQIDSEYQEQLKQALKAEKKETPSDSSDAATSKLVNVKFDDADREALRRLLWGSDAPAGAHNLTFRAEIGLRKAGELGRLQGKANDIKLNHPGSPARAMAVVDASKPKNSKVYIRGDRAKQGDEVPRRFLEIIAGEARKPFRDGSGRLELAQAIVAPDNPLTARVIVNRVWQNHFGQGLVVTPSDFGLRGEPPTHPELLDYLARTFIDDGWSLKKLHKRILLSAVYQQSSDDQTADAAADASGAVGAGGTSGGSDASQRSAAIEAAKKVDPTNSLLWRMNRRRLDLEAMRDTLLSVSGTLDPHVGGRSVDIQTDTSRRTIYSLVDRLNLPGLFTTFDFALPDMSSPQRNETTVPTQALFLMNSPLVIEKAKRLAARDELTKLTNDDDKVRWLYELLYQRVPNESDLEDARAFLEQQQKFTPERAPAPVWKYGLGIIAKSGRVQYTEARRFTGEAWIAQFKAQNDRLIPVSVTDDGGETGAAETVGAVRRWISPLDGAIEISSRLSAIDKRGASKADDAKKDDAKKVDAKKDDAKSDGDEVAVVGRVLLTRGGRAPQQLGEWRAKTDGVDVKLEKVDVQSGDFIDFIATPGSRGATRFHWAPEIRAL
ncbi:MAG TPA: PSD1 and planctomycete cytochrome C domain-containing protein, partial [Pirellulaceae bacterium]|nr:PSD1 and planctomycete cytochrome C domain-containing protein [Pirellulaceae bacterium]